MSPIPENKPILWVADVGVVKEVTGNRNLFPKPLDLYGPLLLYGDVSLFNPRYRRMWIDEVEFPECADV